MAAASAITDMNIKSIDYKPTVAGMVLFIEVIGDKTSIATEIQKAKEHPCTVEIKRIRKGKTKDQNGYYWALLYQLAAALDTSAQELHEQLLERYGVLRTTDNGDPVTFTLRAGIDPTEVAKYTVILKRGSVSGVDVIQYGVLKGSSELTTNEFSRLLDGLISECKEVGIETLTPEEIKRLEGYGENTCD